MKAKDFLGAQAQTSRAQFLAVPTSKKPAKAKPVAPTPAEKTRALASCYQQPNGADHSLEMLVVGLMLAGSFE